MNSSIFLPLLYSPIMKYILTLSCNDQVGIVSKIAGFLSSKDANIIDSHQFGDPLSKRFFMRILFEKESFELNDLSHCFAPIAHSLEAEWKIHMTTEQMKAVILVSRQGHCLLDLLHRSKTGDLPIRIEAIASNHPHLKEMADRYKIPFYYFPLTPETRLEQENKILNLIKKVNSPLVILARYMQILSPGLAEQLKGKAINIHHSFLPSFKGAKPYHQAYERGVKLVGATAHYVTSNLDEGPIIEQRVERVTHTDTPEQLVSLGQDVESRVLLQAIHFHAEHRIFINGNKTVIFR